MPAKHQLPSELTVYHVTNLRTQMQDWLGKPSKRKRTARDSAPLEIDASAVSEVDASGLQLLVSLQRTLAARGRALTLLEPSRTIARACATLGLGSLLVSNASGESA